MHMYKSFYWQYFLRSFITKKTGKVSSKINTTSYNKTNRFFRSITITSITITALLGSLSNATANASTLTSDMSPEIATEFNEMLALQPWPEMHKKLGLMDNPYKKLSKALKKQLKAEAPEGKRKRLMTHEESMLVAKKKRFDYCQASVNFFVSFAERAHSLSKLEDNPLSKDTLMSGNGVKYPFTEAETNNASTRPAQIALELGWKYQGKGQLHAELFLKTCLAVPIELYYKEDK